MKRKTVVFGIALLIIISMSMVIKISTGATKNDDAVWTVTLNFTEPGGKNDYVVFGEASTANDGPLHDSYDTPKPPAPNPPYIRAWFNDGLSEPYDLLWEDYRGYPDTSKVWNLYVMWVPLDTSPTNIKITIEWDPDEFDGNEYDSIILMKCPPNEMGDFTNMLSKSHYTYRSSNEDHFQISCKKTESNGDTNGGDPQQPPNEDPPTGENYPPTANASASETSGFMNTLLNFNGSLSTDTDGYITNWTWDFGDNTTGDGEIVEHAYTNSGIYTATLTVTDNENATDTDTFIVQIAVGNNDPTKPQVNGIIEGHQNTEYIYTAISTDLDDDAICYFFSWGDDNTTISEFLPSGISCFMDHEWLSAGEYEIEVYAYDNKTYSEPTQLTVLIDICYCGSIGYLIDNNGDGIYDVFSCNETGEKTLVEQKDGSYLIDSDGDGNWDYVFDSATGMTTYPDDDGQKETPGFELILVICVIAIIALHTVVSNNKRKWR